MLPPSTTIDWPVTYEAAGEARKAISAATSSGVPGRPTGVFAPARSSSSVEDAVAIQPGATLLTVMPLGPSSSARARVSPSTPALAAPYAAECSRATYGPVTDETFTIRPPAVIVGATRRQSLKTVWR